MLKNWLINFFWYFMLSNLFYQIGDLRYLSILIAIKCLIFFVFDNFTICEFSFYSRIIFFHFNVQNVYQKFLFWYKWKPSKCCTIAHSRFWYLKKKKKVRKFYPRPQLYNSNQLKPKFGWQTFFSSFWWFYILSIDAIRVNSCTHAHNTSDVFFLIFNIYWKRNFWQFK